MADLSISDQLKAAERDKYLAETAKAKSEKEQIDYELKQSKRIFNVKTIWSVIVGVSFLGFFINYVIVPAANKENIELATKNAITSDSLFKQKILLEEKSLILKKQNDTLLMRSHQLTIIQKKYDTLYSEFVKLQINNKNQNTKERLKTINNIRKTIPKITDVVGALL